MSSEPLVRGEEWKRSGGEGTLSRLSKSTNKYALGDDEIIHVKKVVRLEIKLDLIAAVNVVREAFFIILIFVDCPLLPYLYSVQIAMFCL